MALSFRKLKSLQEEAGSSGTSKLNQLFSTHPDLDARIQRMEERATADGIENRKTSKQKNKGLFLNFCKSLFVLIYPFPCVFGAVFESLFFGLRDIGRVFALTYKRDSAPVVIIKRVKWLCKFNMLANKS